MAERVFRRTPLGRPITEYALDSIDAALEDKDNQNQDATVCKNCGMIGSSLLVPEGCNNCGGKDLSTNIITENII
jgi:hypothetical protein